MKQSDIRRYGRELRKSVRGFRLRRKLMEGFRQSLIPLLEDIPSPDYDDLMDAFGPPEQFAVLLLQEEALRPLSPKKKFAFAAVLAILLLVTGVLACAAWNRSEEGVFLSVNYMEEDPPEQYVYARTETFTRGDITWEQPREMEGYLISVHNTGNVPTKIVVRYQFHRKSYAFEVPPQEIRTFAVNDPKPGKHTISFVTPDGTLSGNIQVLLSETEIPKGNS